MLLCVLFTLQLAQLHLRGGYAFLPVDWCGTRDSGLHAQRQQSGHPSSDDYLARLLRTVAGKYLRHFSHSINA
jgi:hypothetical protein